MNVDWVYELVGKEKHIKIKYVKTDFQLADMLTKAFTKTDLWNRLLRLCQLHERQSLPKKQTAVAIKSRRRRQRKKELKTIEKSNEIVPTLAKAARGDSCAP